MVEKVEQTSHEILQKLIEKDQMKIWYDREGNLRGEIYEPVQTSTKAHGVVLTRYMEVDSNGKFTGNVVRVPEQFQLTEDFTIACNFYAGGLLKELSNPK